MAYLALPTSFLFAVVSALFTSIFTLYRLRDRALTTFLLLSLDFGLVIVLPLALINAVSLGVPAVEGLFFSSFLFYAAVFVSYLLFPPISERFSHPLTTVYLFFAALQLILTSLHGELELGLTFFAYKLSDNISLATVICLFISALATPSKQMGLKLKGLIDLRHLENLRRSSQFRVTNTTDLLPYQAAKIERNALQNRPFKHCLKLIKKEEYESCVEYCDMKVERIIASRLAQLYPVRLGAPLTIEEQLSKLRSKGVLLHEESIIRLRKLRNTITISSGQATRSQAKWAFKVLRAVAKPESRSGNGTFVPQKASIS